MHTNKNLISGFAIVISLIMAIPAMAESFNPAIPLLLLDSEDSNPQPCVNIAGDWYLTETLSVTCCEGGYCESFTESGSDTVTIQQDGCKVSYDLYATGYGTVTRTGTIDGNNIHWTGKFVILESWCTATQNVINSYWTVDGNQINGTGKGIATGTCDGSSFSHTGESTVTGTRSSSTANGLESKVLDNNNRMSLIKDGKIFSVIVH